mgnify:CR=1 FL=1
MAFLLVLPRGELILQVWVKDRSLAFSNGRVMCGHNITPFAQFLQISM